MKKIFSLIVSAMILSSCGNVSNPSSNNNNHNNGKNTNTNTNVIDKSNVEKKYNYDLPLKITVKEECSGNMKTLYEIKDGIFTYNLNEEVFGGAETVNDQQSKKLTDDEINSVKKLLDEVNLASLAEKDIQLPKDSPQTEECRSIEGLTIMVNGQEKFFQKNERLVKHTQEYIDGFNKLDDKLAELKSVNVKNIDLDKEFDMKIGEAVHINDWNTILKLSSLVEDSRCPNNVQCVWAGQVVFKLDAYQKFMAVEEFDLKNIEMNDANKKELSDYVVTLTKVSPESYSADKKPQNSDYTVTLKVSKKTTP